MFKPCSMKCANYYLIKIFRSNRKNLQNVIRRFSNFSRHTTNPSSKTSLSSPYYKTHRHQSSSSSASPPTSPSALPPSSSSSSFGDHYGSNYDSDELSDKLFDLISDDNDVVSCSELITNLSSCGLWHNDPRLTRFYDRLQNRKKTTFMPTFFESDRLSRETFKWLIEGSEHLFKKALCDDFVVPDFNRFCKVLNEIYRDCRTNWKGVSSNWPHDDYKAAPKSNYGGSGLDYWGVSVCTVDGQRHSMGDVDVCFPLHSCSWPFNYAFAIKQLGSDEVHRFVGSEIIQSLRSAIHATSSLTSFSSMNPLSLPGSLLIASLLHRNVPTIDGRFDKLLNSYERLVGDDEEARVKVNEELFEVACKGSHHLKSVTHSLAGFNCFPRGTCCDETLNIHMKTSCLEVDVRSLALMASYLANGGSCPISVEPPVPTPSAITVPKLEHHLSSMTRNTLTFMHSSSAFSRTIHLPITTSITGAIIVVVNGVLGMCLWSPPLNGDGVSIRGAQFCAELIKRFNLQHPEVVNEGVKVDPRIRRSFNKTGHIGELLFAAHRGDLSSIRSMHKSGLNMNTRDYDGRTALHVSCAEGNLDCVMFLVDECSASLDSTDRWGHKPLCEAIKFKRSEVEKFLVDRMMKNRAIDELKEG